MTWAFAEMHQLSRLSEILSTLPRTPANDGQVAAPPFELPYSLALPDVESARWRVHQDILDSSAKLIDALLVHASQAERDLLTAIKAQDDKDRQVIASLGAPRIKEIKELRILPPLAIGRFGSSPDPLDNYEARIIDVTGYRRIEPAPTLRIDPAGGHVEGEVIPDAVRFRDRDGKVRPVAPFFELWARFTDDGDLEPLTLGHLDALGLKPADVRWQVVAANMKAARRTGKSGDRVIADTGVFADHEVHALRGCSDNFKADKSIPFGTVRYIRPTVQFPEIRFRFTPGPGRTYGPEPGDPLSVDDVYDAHKGTWVGYWDEDPSAPPSTFPSGTYEGTYEAQTQRYVSGGYFDDSCDGIATAQISPKNLSAQMQYRARGNSPGTLVASSVGNYYPGLELDLRNLWRRLFVGIELHEAEGLVTAVDPGVASEIEALEGEALVAVDGHPILVEVKGPRTVGGPTETLEHWFLEWSNALADILPRAGSKVTCTFTKGDSGTQDIELEVRPVFEAGTSVLSTALAQPGELTQSLCSPWQNDFVGCGCYYWAASRPDYVNVEPDGQGGSRGHNWLEKRRSAATPLRYTLKQADLLDHEDIIESWEDKLKFVIGGRDEK